MNATRAQEILMETATRIEDDGGLYNPGHYIGWVPGDETVVLDDRFYPEELEAIAWWMRNNPKKKD